MGQGAALAVEMSDSARLTTITPMTMPTVIRWTFLFPMSMQPIVRHGRSCASAGHDDDERSGAVDALDPAELDVTGG